MTVYDSIQIKSKSITGTNADCSAQPDSYLKCEVLFDLLQIFPWYNDNLLIDFFVRIPSGELKEVWDYRQFSITGSKQVVIPFENMGFIPRPYKDGKYTLERVEIRGGNTMELYASG